MSDPIIEIRNLSVKYDAQIDRTLKNIDLTINRGEKILIAGPSGSGKSTLSRVLNGMIPEAFPGEVSGELKINGKDVSDTGIFERSLEIGTVLQDSNAQFVGLTTAEDIAFALENDQLGHTKMVSKINEWAEKLDLHSLLNLAPQVLSGGQKQRVAMAGVLVDNSSILIFDEPLANLDPASGYKMMQLLDQIQARENLTVIIIEHRLEEVLQSNVDQVVLLDDGEIKFDGTVEEVLVQNQLADYGLATPAYIRLLKKVGIDIATVQHLSVPERIADSEIAKQIRQFQVNLPVEKQIDFDEPILELKNLNFSYGQHPLFKDLDVQINRGEIVALVGKNGSGKSTLSQLITGFLHEDDGKLIFNGSEDLTQLSIKERGERIGYVTQNPNDMFTQTIVEDEVAIGLKLRDIDEQECKRRVTELLKTAGLYSMRHWPISALSFGQKKRLSMIAVLALEPELLILDEPTAGQDLRHSARMMDFVRKLNDDLKITVIVITHDMALMLNIAHRALVLVDGEIIADVEPATLLVTPDIIRQAELRLTSVYTLTKALGIEHAEKLVRVIAREDQ